MQSIEEDFYFILIKIVSHQRVLNVCIKKKLIYSLVCYQKIILAFV